MGFCMSVSSALHSRLRTFNVTVYGKCKKTRLPHTFNFSTLMKCSLVCECANDLKILHKCYIAYKNKILKS